MKNFIKYSNAKSIRGLSHSERHFPNEDSVLLTHIGSHALVAAVSDGHGSDKCFRAHVGSKIAVSVLQEIFQKKPLPEICTIEEVSAFADALPEMIVKQWREIVDDNLVSYPYSSAEQRYDGCKENHYLPYGCTLLGCYITSKFGIFCQIGDGDIFASSINGTTKRIVLEDKRQVGDETMSLCLPDAENDFRISVVDFSLEKLDVVILATDGLSKSHPTDADLFKWTTDIRDIMIQDDGREIIDANLSKWLDEVSVGGSADDISMAVIVIDDAPMDEVSTDPKDAKEEPKMNWLKKVINRISKSV